MWIANPTMQAKIPGTHLKTLTPTVLVSSNLKPGIIISHREHETRPEHEETDDREAE
jgi:hypothetical protein